MKSYLIRRENMTVELLLFQAYGLAGVALVEQTLQLNPGLSELGPIIPLDTTVVIPDRPQGDQVVMRRVVSLFG